MILTYFHIFTFQPQLAAYRFFVLFGGGLFALFGFRAAGVSGAGALGCLVMAFFAGQGWQMRGWPSGEVILNELKLDLSIGTLCSQQRKSLKSRIQVNKVLQNL